VVSASTQRAEAFAPGPGGVGDRHVAAPLEGLRQELVRLRRDLPVRLQVVAVLHPVVDSVCHCPLTTTSQVLGPPQGGDGIDGRGVVTC
jgi:hypothetical protein